MEIWRVTGGNRLEGSCFVQGSKNAALPILAASVMSGCVTELLNVPKLSDIDASVRILRQLGCTAEQTDNDIYIDSGQLNNNVIPREMMECMRSSVLFMGALLARCGEVTISKPGGCKLGERPIDLHLKAMEALGAEISEECDRIVCTAKALKGAEIKLPFPSVGATENAMIAACKAEGETRIINAAREPEIVDLQDYLLKMGAYIRGAGSNVITINGFEAETHVGHRVIPDRIAASTILCAAAASGGDVELRGVDINHFSKVLFFLNAAGCDIISTNRSVRLVSDGILTGLDRVVTEPFPGFPTDAQPLLMAALLRSRGRTVFDEQVFSGRFCHARQLKRFGADISIIGNEAEVWGVSSLNSAIVNATDLRGGAAMLIAGMCAEGTSEIMDTGHICRGYENFDYKLRSLGAEVYMDI